MEDHLKEPYLPYASPNDPWSTIEANNQTLLRQAPMTANEYLLSAVDHIDQKLGNGYAKQCPELIAAFMQASAIDLGTAVIARAVESLSNSLVGALNEMQESLQSLQAVADVIDNKQDQ
jgi:hypothetical protein